MNLSLRSTTFSLANGLQVVVHTDTTVSAVAVAITYKAGSQQDPPGVPGIAHLVEHLMAHGTGARRSLELSELVASYGGVRRAFTTRSHTRYESLVPKDALTAVLRAEAERMRAFQVDDRALAREQAVILEEMRVLSATVPYAAARDASLADAAFTRSPNRHSTVGTPEAVRSARLEDVRAFHEAYYGPNNAVLALAGDINLREAHRLADRFFAGVTARDLPAPSASPGLAEPPLAANVRRLVGDRFASVPLLVSAWPAPSRGTTDSWALMLAATMLNTSGGGQLYRELSRAGLALDASCAYPWWGGTFAPCDPDLFGITITLKRGASSDAALAAAEAILADLTTNGIESHLVAAKNQTALAWTRTFDSLLDRARVLSGYAGLIGDPVRIADDSAAVAAITPALVGDALRTWIIDRPRVVIEVQPDPEAVLLPAVPPPATPPEPPRPFGDATRRARKPHRSAGAPPIERFRLSNGLEVHCIRNGRLPLLELRLLMRGGGVAELEGEEGSATAAADFMASQLAAGRGTDATPAALGWTMATMAGPMDLTLRAGGLSRTAPQFVRAAAAAVTAPDDCTERALSLWAASKREEVRIRSERLPAIASQRLRRRLFGTHALGRTDPFGGVALTDREIATVTQASVRRWRGRAMCPDAAGLIVVGDADPAALRDVLEEAFHEWTRAAPTYAPPPPPAAPIADAEIVDRPGCGSTFVVLGQTVPIGPVHPDYLACVVANELLGGGSTLSRLFDRLRVQNRYTYYSLYSQFRSLGEASLWVVWAGVRAEVAAATLEEIRREIARLREELVPESTLDTIKQYIGGRFLLRRDSLAGQADALADFARNGQDAAYEFATFHDRLAPLTPTHLRDAVRRCLDPTRMITIVVGEAAPLEPLLIS